MALPKTLQALACRFTGVGVVAYWKKQRVRLRLTSVFAWPEHLVGSRCIVFSNLPLSSTILFHSIEVSNGETIQYTPLLSERRRNTTYPVANEKVVEDWPRLKWLMTEVRGDCFACKIASFVALSGLTVCAGINSKSQRSSGQSRACVTACSRPSPRTDEQAEKNTKF